MKNMEINKEERFRKIIDFIGEHQLRVFLPKEIKELCAAYKENKDFNTIPIELWYQAAGFSPDGQKKTGNGLVVFLDTCYYPSFNSDECVNILKLIAHLWIEEPKETIRPIQIENLSGYNWHMYPDGSGSIESPGPVKEHYFSYDMIPYSNIGGIEYAEKSGKGWGIYYGTLKDFLQYAENRLSEIIIENNK